MAQTSQHVRQRSIDSAVSRGGVGSNGFVRESWSSQREGYTDTVRGHSLELDNKARLKEQVALLLAERRAEEEKSALLQYQKDEIRPPAAVPQPEAQKPIPPIIIIPIWIVLSCTIVLFNKYFFSTLNFPYPMFLTGYHMLIATVGTSFIRLLPSDRLKISKVEISWAVWCRTILPLSIFFASSLVLSNLAYVHLSVSFVQMLKTLIFQLIAGLSKYSHFQSFVIVCICSGCYIAASGEVHFNMFGFACQLAAAEALRVVLTDVVLRGHKLDPLSSLAMYAPVCMLLICSAQPFLEGSAPIMNMSRVGVFLLLCNGVLAFLLNCSFVFFVQSAGGVVLSMSGVLRDIFLISFSYLALGSNVTPNQVFGYVLSAGALFIYRVSGGRADTAMEMLTSLQPLKKASRTAFIRMSKPANVAMAAVGVVILGSLATWHHTSGRLAAIPVEAMGQQE